MEMRQKTSPALIEKQRAVTESLKPHSGYNGLFEMYTPATIALAVKNTKLMGTTSVASNIFMA